MTRLKSAFSPRFLLDAAHPAKQGEGLFLSPRGRRSEHGRWSACCCLLARLLPDSAWSITRLSSHRVGRLGFSGAGSWEARRRGESPRFLPQGTVLATRAFTRRFQAVGALGKRRIVNGSLREGSLSPFWLAGGLRPCDVFEVPPHLGSFGKAGSNRRTAGQHRHDLTGRRGNGTSRGITWPLLSGENHFSEFPP